MAANPQFASTGMSSDGTVWGWFKDGVLYFVATNDADLGQPVASSTPAAAPAATRSAKAARAPRVAPPARQQSFATQRGQVAAGELPGSAQAYVFNAQEANRLVPSAQIAAELTAAGYQVTSSTGSLADWKSISNAAVVYTASHGDPLPTSPGANTYAYYIEVSDIWTPLDFRYLINYPAGQVIIGTVDVLDQPLTRSRPKSAHPETHYWINADYIGKPGAFAANSLLVSAACSSTSLWGAAFAQYLSTSSGLGVYFGWSKPVLTLDANESSQFLFDRLLGLNQFEPIDPSLPPPTDWNAVYTIMGSTQRASGVGSNLATSYSIGGATANLQVLNYGNAGLTTIIPSIADVSLDSTAQFLVLTGSFGTDQGTVRYNSTDAPVQSWSTGSISIVKPTALQGLVKVTSPNQLLSNVYNYVGGAVQISPSQPTVFLGSQTTFTATLTTGQLPANPTYRWTLTGNGSIGSTSTVTTSAPTISYTAPNIYSQDNLQVEILDSTGTVDFAGATQITDVYHVVISPAAAQLATDEQQTFTASAVGIALPAGVKYLWSLNGTGSLTGGSPQTTTANSIGYTAPSANGADTLSVQVEDGAGNDIGSASNAIVIGQPSLQWTISYLNNWPGYFAAGNYNDPFNHVSVLENAGLAEISVFYDIVEITNSETANFFLSIASGTTLQAGQVLSYFNGSGLYAGYFQFTDASTLAGQGSMNIVSVTPLSDGSSLVSFTFSCSTPLAVASGSGTFVLPGGT
jgi:hypothetical protein